MNTLQVEFFIFYLFFTCVYVQYTVYKFRVIVAILVYTVLLNILLKFLIFKTSKFI